MEDLLTSKQVQELLQVERITVYRMLNDNRLQGIKIGKQWRFPASQFENMRGSDKSSAENAPHGVTPLPVHCMQTIQDLFSDLSQIGTLIIDTNGTPLTHLRNSCQFCQFMLHSPRGERACRASWQSIAGSERQNGWTTCHAGLTYHYLALKDDGANAAYLLAGQSRISDQPADVGLMRQLANSAQLDEADLIESYAAIHSLDAAKQAQIEIWTSKVANALEGILAERSGLLKKLQQISEISQVIS